MTQLVTRMDDELVAAVEKLVAEGVLASRSEAVRTGLLMVVDQHRCRLIGARIVEGFRREPQTAEELVGWMRLRLLWWRRNRGEHPAPR